jgi:uncharacterized alpha-E superfamily protein
MLSRIAESLYWIGRYVERAEDTARISDVAYHHTLGMGISELEADRRRHQWESLVQIAGDPALFAARYGEANDDTVPFYLTFDTENQNSIVVSIARARELARALRHQIASEMWEALNSFYLELQQRRELATVAGPVGHAANAHLFNRSVKEFSHLFQGLTDSTLPRDEGWYFLQAGKFLERAGKTARALNVRFEQLSGDAPDMNLNAQPDPDDWRQWQALLRAFSAYEAYHKMYRTAVQPLSIVDMVLLSPIFPRSVRFAVGEVDRALAAIAGEPWRYADDTIAGRKSEAQRSIGKLRSVLFYARTDEVVRAGLPAFLLDVETRCRTIGDQMYAEFFSPRIMRPEEVVA